MKHKHGHVHSLLGDGQGTRCTRVYFFSYFIYEPQGSIIIISCCLRLLGLGSEMQDDSSIFCSVT